MSTSAQAAEAKQLVGEAGGDVDRLIASYNSDCPGLWHVTEKRGTRAWVVDLLTGVVDDVDTSVPAGLAILLRARADGNPPHTS